MACERFVYWTTERRPSKDDLAMVLEDYVSGVGSVDRGERLIATIIGKTTHPLRRMPEASRNAVVATEEIGERWFEVYVDDDHIDVITRHADPLTSRIADGFAELCAHFWDGRLER